MNALNKYNCLLQEIKSKKNYINNNLNAQKKKLKEKESKNEEKFTLKIKNNTFIKQGLYSRKFNRLFLSYIFFINFIIVQVSSNYDIKITLLSSKDSRLMKRGAQNWCYNRNSCTNSDSKISNKDSNYYTINGENNEKDFFYFRFSSRLNSMKGLFKNCSNITSIEFINFDFSNVIDTSEMFHNCSSLKTISFGNIYSNYRATKVITMSYMFSNCSSLLSIDLKNYDTSLVTDMSYLFTNCSTLESLDLSSLKTNKVNNMKSMFESCSNLIELKQNFDTSSVTSMEYMFSNCKNLESLNISNFDVTKVISINSLFKGCSKLNQLNLSKTKTSSLINMGSMFQSCSSIASLDLSNLDTSSVQFMDNLFHDCISLKSQTKFTFNTENVIKMDSMFENCQSLINIDLSAFYTPSLRQMHHIFSGCTKAKTITLTKFDTFQVTNFANLFTNCNSLESISIGHFVTLMAANMSQMFCNCSTLVSIDLSKFYTKKVTNMNSMFKGCSSLISVDLKNFENDLVEDMGEMFSGCIKLKDIKKDVFGTSKVKYMQKMFKGCKEFTSLDLNYFSTNNVINMNSMFSGCTNLHLINISNFNTSKVKDMESLFYDCSKLSSLDLSNFDTHNVINMDSMFFNCKNIKSLSLKAFNTSNVQSMRALFKGCSSFELLNLTNFKTEKVLYMDSLFYGCGSLIKLDLKNFNISKVKSMTFLFYGCKSLTSIDLPNIRNLSVTNTAYMFSGCSSLTSINLANFDSSSLTDMNYMFSECSYIKELSFINWNTTQVRTMDYLFSGCSSLYYIDLSYFRTPKLESIKGMFYSCYSLKSLDLRNFNTTSVKNMEYIFYKDFSLKSIDFYNYYYDPSLNYTRIKTTYFNTSLVENMRYIFAYCTSLAELDLSIWDTSNVKDMSFMFKNCSSLTSVDLSSFQTNQVTSIEQIFANCHKLALVNLNKTTDENMNNMYNILAETPLNMVFCFEQNKAQTLYNKIMETKEGCSVVNCDENYFEHRKKIILDLPENDKDKCVPLCKEKNKYDYEYFCYDKCPNETFYDEAITIENFCSPLEFKPPDCTLQGVLLGDCLMEKYETPYNNTKEDKEELIKDIRRQIRNFDIIIPKILKNQVFAASIYNETYQFSTFSNREKIHNLTFIDFQDCENTLKKEYSINANEELILFKIEYFLEEFKIPIIEYLVFRLDGVTELNISYCNKMKFRYSIPITFNLSDDYKYDPNSDYHKKICFNASEHNTDMILYERKKQFNELNLSLCESNCKFLGFEENRIECECPVKPTFNEFLLQNEEEIDNLIYRFKDNQLEPFNFGVLKCIKKIFTKDSLKSNYANILYIAILSINFISAVTFCIKEYKLIYVQMSLLVETLPNQKAIKKPNTKVKIAKNGNNIITTGKNPPKKVKNKVGDLIFSANEKKGENGKKLEDPSSLIDSGNMLKMQENQNNTILELNKPELDEVNQEKLLETDMEINMLSYNEALRRDKRHCFIFYFSFLKTRHILVCIFVRDFNAILFKICFFFFVLGNCLGLNTFFIDDKVIQKMYEERESYNIVKHIIYQIVPIGISTIAASLIKTLVSLLTFTDVVVLGMKDIIGVSNEEKINKAIMKVAVKSATFFVINTILMTICWLYAGSFCAVFINTQIYLFISAAISLGGVMFLPLLYYLIAALLRSMALGGKNSNCLYKLSQIMELI